MKFSSTRNHDKEVTFKEALFKGLADDGGLFFPTTTPDLTALFHSFSDKITFSEMAGRVIGTLLADEMTIQEAMDLAEKTFPFEPALIEAGKGIKILELFHGPSCAFKDYGASFLASSMDHFLQGESRRAVILTATSGDTGSAVAQAFYGKKNIDVVILYPSGKVSPLQEKQLTTLGGNITALEINGVFDDCQKMVKDAFTDSELKNRIPLSSANSINLGRLIPQSLYYIWAWTRLRAETPEPVICVPSGNFGNLTAGLYAHSWGLPVSRFLAATNANDVVPDYLDSGIYTPRASQATFSNAMDVGQPSNFERISEFFGSDVEKMRSLVSGFRISDEETLSTMKRIHTEEDYLLCPHTAVGYLAAERFRLSHPEASVLVLSTAHPGKFLEVVEEATGVTPVLPKQLNILKEKKKQSLLMDPDHEIFKNFLLENYGS